MDDNDLRYFLYHHGVKFVTSIMEHFGCRTDTSDEWACIIVIYCFVTLCRIGYAVSLYHLWHISHLSIKEKLHRRNFGYAFVIDDIAKFGIIFCPVLAIVHMIFIVERIKSIF